MKRLYYKLIIAWELRRLYDSEINVQISSFWDGGWMVKLGDEINGFQRPDWDTCEIHEIAPAIRELARKHCPDSTYVRHLPD